MLYGPQLNMSGMLLIVLKAGIISWSYGISIKKNMVFIADTLGLNLPLNDQLGKVGREAGLPIYPLTV